MRHSTGGSLPSTPLVRLLLLSAALAGCAAEPPPRPAYEPPARSQPAPVAETEPALRAGPGGGDTDNIEFSGVRGLTFEEFKACMEQKAALKTLTGHLKTLKPVLDGEQKQIETEDGALAKARASIDPANGDAVDGFNARLGRQHEHVRVFNRRIDAFNAEVEKQRRAQGAFSLNCAKRPFRATDVERLPSELQAVAREDVEDFDLPAYFTDTPPPRAPANLDLSY